MANIILHQIGNTAVGLNSVDELKDWGQAGFSYELCSDLSHFFETPLCFFEFLVAHNAPSEVTLDIATGEAELCFPFSPFWETLTIKTFDSTEDSSMLQESINIEKMNEETKHRLSLLGELLHKQKEDAAEQKCAVAVKRKIDQKERLFESKLEAFLQVNEISVERQVCSTGKRLDLWIPGQLMIECKVGRITGDDVCQAIDYLATFERDILLIGTGLSTAASRGIEAINKISPEAKILFVTQEASFGYLKAVCK